MYLRRIGLRTLPGLVLLVFLSACPSSAAAEVALKVAVFDRPPLLFMSDSGVPSGLFVDVLTEVARQEDWQLTWIPLTADQALQQFRNGDIDLLAAVGYSEERSRQFTFAREHLTTDWGVVFRRQGEALSSTFDLKGRRVAVLKGSNYTEGLRHYLKGFNVNATLVEKDDYSEAFAALTSGDCDAAVANHMTGLGLEQQLPVERTPIIFSPANITFAALKGRHSDVVFALDRHLTAMMAEPDSFLHQKTRQWLAIPEDHRKERWLTILAVVVVILLIGTVLLAVRAHMRTIALSRQRKLLQELINATTDTVFIKDTAGRYQLVNREVELLFGRKQVEIIGLDDTHFFPAGAAAAIMAKDRMILAGRQTTTFEETVEMGGGKRIWLATKGVLTDSRGTVTGLFGISRDITERRHAEEMLRDQQQLLTDILEESLSGYWDWNLVAHTEYLSPAFKRMFGYDDHELPNVPESWQAIIFPEDLPAVLAAFDRHVASRGGVAFHNIVRYRHKNGSTVWVLCSGRVIEWADDGAPVRMVGCHVDITAQKQAEQDLVNSRNQLDMALKSAQMGVWTLNLPDQRFYFDAQVSNLLGIDPQDFGGTVEEFYRVVHHADRQMLRDDLSRAIDQGETYETEYRVVPPDGEIRHLKAFGRLSCDEHGKRLRVDGVLWDITGMKLQTAKAWQLSKLAALGEMASGVGHEINNPVNGIINCAQLLKERLAGDDSCQGIVTRIHREGERIARIVKSLLSIAMPGQLKRETFHIKECVDTVLTLSGDKLVNQGIDLQVHLPANLPPVNGELQQLEQVLLNLINNSRYALNERFPCSHPDKCLRISASCYGAVGAERILIEVYDQGTGIRKEALGRIFDPFFTTKPAGVGTGLGLGLCHEIIKRHGGEIRVESVFGNFTRVTVELPVLL